jgi:radical SAM protein with 4Fe4S-binding SPASM domain
MSTDQAKALIDQLAALGQSQPMMPIMVFSGGEPLCRPDLFELIVYAKSQGILPALATNGTLIDEAMAERIAASGVERVSISLDGATAEMHDHMRQLKGSFDQAVQGIQRLHSKGVPFQINMTVTQHNRHQLTDLYDLAQSLGAVAVHPFMLVPVGCGVELAETDMMTPSQYEESLKVIVGLEQRGDMQIKVTCGPHYERVKREAGLHHSANTHGAVPGGHGHGASSRGCLAGMGVIFVGHRGDVFPCGYLPVLCGNVLETSLSDIWRHSKDLTQLSDSNALEGKCGACGFKKVCGGCRARAYAETQNYLAEEPFCVYKPKGSS